MIARMTRRTIRSTLIVLLCLTMRTLGEESRGSQLVPLDFDWRFVLGEVKGAEQPNLDDSKWRRLDLPHDWGIEGEYRQDNPAGGAGAYLPGGIAWYRKAIDVPSEWKDRRVAIEFDAAQRNSEVWINGQSLGRRPYGYISFAYDLTPHLKPGRNVLAVRLDNSQLPAARWYTGSGIYSHVRLVVRPPIHVPQWGVFVAPISASKESAKLAIQTSVVNSSNERASVRIISEIVDDRKATIARGEAKVTIDAGATANDVASSITVAQPRLWSPDSPALYKLVTRIFRDEALQHEQTTTFGIRTFRWDANNGFWLNDQNIKLKGVGMHYDAGPMGVAIPDRILEQRLLLLKCIGSNAVRTGHTPFPPTFYDLCDRMGLLVLDEVFDGWRKKAKFDYGATAFNEWWQRDLTDWVRRDRNHACVFLWSIGNETGDEDRFGMTKIIHDLDPTRATTGGQCLFGVDVSGFNGPGESPGVLEKFHREHPNQPIVLTEEPHGYQTRGFYKTLTWWRDKNPAKRVPFQPYAEEEVFKFGGDPQYNSSYDNATVRITTRQSWKVVRDTPWIPGEFRWAGFDYLGEASVMKRHWPARYWHPGIIDAAGFPKDIVYFYQSQWSREPMVHLLPHWTHPLIPRGTKIPVVAYSNCDEVELFLNGKSLGRQKPRAELLDFVWDVPYEPGELRAAGYRDGAHVESATVRTAGDPVAIQMSLQGQLTSKRGDATAASVQVVDSAGTSVPWANNRIDFRLRGPARLLGYENGNNVDVTPHRVDHRNLFNGLARGFFQATGEEGEIELTAAAILGDQLFQEKTTVAMDVERFALRGELSPAKLQIHYTLDGSEPTTASSKYESPIAITSPTTVRMLVLRDGQSFITSEAKFEKGTPPVIDDPRYER
jgi:beta-galactosidase